MPEITDLAADLRPTFRARAAAGLAAPRVDRVAFARFAPLDALPAFGTCAPAAFSRALVFASFVFCVIRRKPAGHSAGSQPVIPTEASHPFRGIPATPE